MAALCRMSRVREAAVFVAFAMTGCAIINPDYYHSVPTAEICRQLMVYPSYNVNHPARMQELARRGESCGSPADIAAAQRQKDAEAAALLNTLATPPPSQPAPIQCSTRWFAGQWVTTCP